jgi:hypothetical protein
MMAKTARMYATPLVAIVRPWPAMKWLMATQPSRMRNVA